MLQELYRFQILIAAVDIGHPFPILLSVIQVEHGGHRIHPDAVGVILVRPEQCIGNEEVGDLGPSVIVNQGAPMGMGTFSGILMLINAGPVKTRQSMGVSWKMGGNPIQNHSDSLTVHIIHKIHEIVRRAVTAGRGVISGHLITPGGVQRMLHHRKQLHMGIAHLFHILCQKRGYFAVIVKFRSGNIISLLVLLEGMAHPGAQMNLVNQHGLFLGMRCGPLLHPFLVLPLIVVNIPDH